MRNLLMLLLVACGGDDAPDPHAVVACEGSAWGSVTSCEMACSTMPANFRMGAPEEDPCEGTYNGASWHCWTTFEYEGQKGCCAPTTNPEVRVVFVECP